MILKIRTYVEREYSILIDFSQIQTIIEEENPVQQNIQELVQIMRQQNDVRNIPINAADERGIQNIEKMVRDIKDEINFTELPKYQETQQEIQKEEKMREDEARIYDDKYPLNPDGERTIYKGETTVSYELSGRRHTRMSLPVYKCRSGGKIVVDIVVNNYGYVLTAEINTVKSQSDDACLIDAAKRAAIVSRFTVASQARQQGTITYIFQAQ